FGCSSTSGVGSAMISSTTSVFRLRAGLALSAGSFAAVRLAAAAVVFLAAAAVVFFSADAVVFFAAVAFAVFAFAVFAAGFFAAGFLAAVFLAAVVFSAVSAIFSSVFVVFVAGVTLHLSPDVAWRQRSGCVRTRLRPLSSPTLESVDPTTARAIILSY